MTGKEAEQRINELVSVAKLEIMKATQLANDHYISFNWDLAYGMGGTYQPLVPKISRKEALNLVEDAETFNNLSNDKKYFIKNVIANTEYDDESWTSSDSYDGWQSSSEHC